MRPLGARDDRRIREAEWQVGIAAHQGSHSRKILLAAFQGEAAGLEVPEKKLQDALTQPLFDQVSDLGEDARRHKVGPGVVQKGTAHAIVIRVAPVEQGENR